MMTDDRREIARLLRQIEPQLSDEATLDAVNAWILKLEVPAAEPKPELDWTPIDSAELVTHEIRYVCTDLDRSGRPTGLYRCGHGNTVKDFASELPACGCFGPMPPNTPAPQPIPSFSPDQCTCCPIHGRR